MIDSLKSIFRKFRKKIEPIITLVRLTPYLFKVRNDADLKRICCSYIDYMPLCLFSDSALWVKLVLNSSKRFKNPYQRPRHPSLYVPHLKSLPSKPAEPIANLLEDNWNVIRQEFKRVEHLEVTTPSKKLIDEGTWSTVPLMRSSKVVKENTALCPRTWSVVNQCCLLQGVRGDVYFSIIYPGTHIHSHCGPSNLKLRYHLTIEEAEGAKIRSAETWRTWREGECLILDDSLEHEVVHEGNKRRVVLIVDCWHPDLSEKERLFLTKVHKIWGRV